MALTKNCIRCGTEQVLRGVTTAGLAAWRSGTVLQRALPDADVNTREMLLSGICSECYAVLFPPSDEVAAEAETGAGLEGLDEVGAVLGWEDEA